MLTLQPESWLTEHALISSFFPLRLFPAPPSSSVAVSLSMLSLSSLTHLGLLKLLCQFSLTCIFPLL